MTYLELPNIMYTLEPLLLVLVLIHPEVQSCLLSISVYGYLSQKKARYYSYQTEKFIQWQHACIQDMSCLSCNPPLLLLLYWWYHDLHIIYIFVPLHVYIGPNIIQNIVEPFHPHRNSTSPFIHNSGIDQKKLSQTYGIWTSYFALDCHSVPHGIHPWVHLQSKNHQLWWWGQPHLWYYFLLFIRFWRRYLYQFTDLVLMNFWISHQKSHFFLLLLWIFPWYCKHTQQATCIGCYHQHFMPLVSFCYRAHFFAFWGGRYFLDYLCLKMRTHAFGAYVKRIYKTNNWNSFTQRSRITHPIFLKVNFSISNMNIKIGHSGDYTPNSNNRIDWLSFISYNQTKFHILNYCKYWLRSIPGFNDWHFIKTY